MREFSGPVSVILALAIVCTLVTIDRVVIARTPGQQAKQPAIETIQCDDTGHYLTRIYRRGEIVHEKPNPGRTAKAGGTAGGAAGIGPAVQQGCEAPGGRTSSPQTANHRTSGTM
jgi:hypothetical protein